MRWGRRRGGIFNALRCLGCNYSAHHVTLYLSSLHGYPPPNTHTHLLPFFSSFPLVHKQVEEKEKHVACRQIKTSTGHRVMFHFNLFVVIIQTCSTVFCKMKEKKKKTPNNLSQINEESTLPDRSSKNNLPGFKMRLLSVHTNGTQIGINT